MRTNKPLPEMTVEKRESTTAHRVPAPNMDEAHVATQLSESIQLNADAGLYKVREMMYREVDEKLAEFAWPDTTTDILIKYIKPFYYDVTKQEIIQVAKEVLQCPGFDMVARWVQDDMCSEVFNRQLKYVIKKGQPEIKNKGFINGSGFGYLKNFVKIGFSNIQEAFDAKYFYEGSRPLVLLFEKFGLDLTNFANKIHPGHFTIPQGHSCKGFSSLETLRYSFKLDKDCDRALFISCIIFFFGRDGNLIHKPEDGIASGFTTGLKEFA